MSDSNPIKRIFDLYTSDLSYNEIERLVKREAGEVYEFFSKDIPKADQTKSKFYRSLIFIRSLFNAFILKLSPARRIFYFAALLFFFVGYSQPSNFYLILSFIIFNLLLAFELADKLSARSELDVARKIQSDIIPKHGNTIKKFEISSYYEPAREVGGDYFDLVEKDNKTYLFVGDISGKGMAAALYMVVVKSIFHLLLDSISDLKELIIQFKYHFSKNLRKENFITLNTALINEDGTLKVIRAGHGPFYHYKSSSQTIESIAPTGIGIGFNDRGVFEKTLEEVEIRTELNDILFFFTDGVNETMNETHQEFGEERIKILLKNNAFRTSDEIKNILLWSITQYRGTTPQFDDLTFVILKDIGNHS